MVIYDYLFPTKLLAQPVADVGGARGGGRPP